MSKTAVMGVIEQNETIGPMVLRMIVSVPEIAAGASPGQFVHLRAGNSNDPLLRRPLSIAGSDGRRLTLIYRVAGRGTALLARFRQGDLVDCMGPLGAGFDLDCRAPLLVGGGLGLAPLLYLTEALCPRPVEVVMGGRTREELFWQSLYAQVCRNTHITTDDGSLGRRGYAADLLPELLASGRYDRVFTCGPRPMMRAVAAAANAAGVSCQVSLEEHMACGVGACLTCTCAGTDGIRRKVCTDGPVFWAGEVPL